MPRVPSLLVNTKLATAFAAMAVALYLMKNLSVQPFGLVKGILYFANAFAFMGAGIISLTVSPLHDQQVFPYAFVILSAVYGWVAGYIAQFISHRSRIVEFCFADAFVVATI